MAHFATCTTWTAALISAGLGYLTYSQLRPLPRRAGTQAPTETVVIVGASSGLGREVALQYAARGARILLVARRHELLASLAAECASAADAHPATQVAYHVADISDPVDVAATAEAWATSLSNDNEIGSPPVLDTLILCAGIISVRPFTEWTASFGESDHPPASLQDRLTRARGQIDRIMGINFSGLVTTTQAFLPYLQRAPAGRVVVISSAAGKTGTPTRSLYAASKHALHGFFDSLRIELAAAPRVELTDYPEGQRVSAPVSVCLVCPATIDTDLRRTAVDLPSEPRGATPNVADRNSLQPSPAPAVQVAGSQKRKLSPAACAARVIRAADNTQEREVFIPKFFSVVPWIQLVWPGLLDYLASRKYGMV
ncbi:hypothetical protein IWQ60_008753 [Tieghemiomyces parasiticus]|uniref:Ketoreductase domain-containing protein n=1 Tax=Tieghemiomyces parasiticus TaxID=78921 RepID=A0A9W7ZWI7_9FUNG|nr:hypothetical protein IWQ60_008753 [Tieghemiomyces parasiticus]